MQKISKSAINRLPVGAIIADSNPVGFVARRLKSGTVSYGYRYRDNTSGLQRWVGLGHGDISPDQARKKALKVAGEVKDGGSPASAATVAAKRRQAAGYTVDGLLDNFLERYARPNLRSADEIERCFRVYVRPKIGSKSIYDLRRRDVVGLLDAIEDAGAPVMADRVLAHLRRALNWYATRDDQFAPPIVKGMSRARPAAERARSRILDDQEIRDLWAALDDLGDEAPACFPNLVRTLFLTATRRAMVGDLAWDEIEGRNWTAPAGRNKGGRDHLVPLTDAVIDLLGERRAGFVFSSDHGKTPFSGFSKAKAALDAKLAELRKRDGHKPMAPWVLHDLRRTARSLMSRAGISSDHAERVLGHVIPGIRATYDRHQFADEKRDALEKLGALVERILQPGETVVGFPKRASRRRKAT